jgi:uncharacterized protein (TIGR02300 family)
VAKPELGTKRLCGSCAAKFYDLNKNPIICPKCNTVFEVTAIPSRGRPDGAGARAAAVPDEETVLPETQDAEFVSLEEADAEASGKKPAKVAGTEATDDDIEIDDEALDDAAFIEEQEEGDDDVTDIIGDVDNEEEP